MCGFFFFFFDTRLFFPPRTVQFSDTSWISYDATEFFHYLPGVSDLISLGLGPTRLPPFRMLGVSPDHLYSWPTSVKLWVLGTLLGFENWLEYLAKFRGTVYYYQFIIKDTTAKWKRCLGQGMGEGCGTSMPFLGEPPSHHFNGHSNSEALQTPLFRDFYGGSIV